MNGEGAGIAEGGNGKLGQPWDWRQWEAAAAPRGHLQAGTIRGGLPGTTSCCWHWPLKPEALRRGWPLCPSSDLLSGLPVGQIGQSPLAGKPRKWSWQGQPL